MKKITYKIYQEYGALNSAPVFNAVDQGLTKLGYTKVDQGEQIPIIWSVLWQGRMERNREVYLRAIRQNKPVLIIEVGNLRRNINWRVSINNVNGLGIFSTGELDINRPNILGIDLKDYNHKRNPEILLTTQHEHSLQWRGMPSTDSWLRSTISEIRKYSDRKIVVRPHPRAPKSFYLNNLKNVEIQFPKKIIGSYDSFDISYNYHSVINYNSGPTIQAAVEGTPIICDKTSLAYPISNILSDIEDLKYPNRQDWFLKLCHTEWTIDEISQGIPFLRLQSEIEKFFN